MTTPGTENPPLHSGDDSIALSLRLYVADGAPNSSVAQANLRAILASYPDVRYELEIVDSLREPHRALHDGVIVTPTLLKLAPPPTRRVIGTLSEAARVVAALGLAKVQHV